MSGDGLSEPARSEAVVALVLFCSDRGRRERLLELFRADASLKVVGISADEGQLRDLLGRVGPQVVVADDPSEKLLGWWPRRIERRSALVVLLDEAEAERRVRFAEAGAQAVLARSCGAAIISALKLVGAGCFVLPTDLLPSAAGAVAEHATGHSIAARLELTPRELDVVAAMAGGASNKAIARQLGISFHTAKFHVAAILAKLDADSRTEAVARAAQLGLIML
ncbi:MAG: response regulator transcription factor [Candidatus Sulfotelmatobacter sp.]